MSAITTHILDTSRGRPAPGVPVTLAIRDGNVWNELGEGQTDNDGRLKTLLEEGPLKVGNYRIRFDTESYFSATKVEAFYPVVEIHFSVRVPTEHYHVPLLLNPYGYSTYRGS